MLRHVWTREACIVGGRQALTIVWRQWRCGLWQPNIGVVFNGIEG